MIKLNRLQLILCWVLSLLISYFVVAPIIEIREYYNYKSKDGWKWEGFTSRHGEVKDENGIPCRISEKNLDGIVGRKYYYEGSYKKYSLDFDRGRPMFPQYPHERIIIVIIINGLLLIYTLGWKNITTHKS